MATQQPKMPGKTHVMIVDIHEGDGPIPVVSHIFYGETAMEVEEAFAEHCGVDDFLAIAAAGATLPDFKTDRERAIGSRQLHLSAVLTDTTELAKHFSPPAAVNATPVPARKPVGR